MLKHRKMISIYSVTHFLVDFACAFLMFYSISRSPEWFTYILIYNFCAFAMQMPIGIIADRLDRNHIVAGAGCVLIATAFGLTSIPLAAAIIIGLGNGMFHIGGGIDILNISEEKSSALGIFVSPGAFGVFFGTMLGRADVLLSLPLVFLLSLAAWYIFTLRRVRGDERIIEELYTRLTRRVEDGEKSEKPEATPTFIQKEKRDTIVSNAPFNIVILKSTLFIMICLFFVVCLRSYVGLAIEFPWKNAGYLGLALVCASAFGKTAGGFLSDRFGPLKTAVLTLGIASLLFLIPQIPAAGILAIFLFNMSMPITLWYMAKIFPGAKGFSFGLLTFALFIGFLPVHYNAITLPYWVYAVLAAVSLILLSAGIIKKDGRKPER